MKIKIAGLHPDLEGFRIAQISDLHISPGLRPNLVQHIVDRVNGLSPDVIALTGDISDGEYSQVQRDVDRLAGLRTREGVFFVTGNHEHIAGADSWITVMKHLGFTVLRNEYRLIHRGRGVLLLGGVDDYGSQDSRPADAMGADTKADVNVLLAHQPDSIYDAGRAGFDLQLSGHTHGGLIRPIRWLASLQAPFQSGLYRHNDTQIYVSNGTGYWGIPFRLGAPPEISLLSLSAIMYR